MNLALPRKVAVLDACVLYPMPLRDLLLHLADFELFQPKWSAQIHEEWQRNLLVKRPDLTITQLKRTEAEMNRAFPDAMVAIVEVFVSKLTLPDPGDRHVLAAAIVGEADVIVTSNLRDFPASYISKFNIVAIHPDEFILKLMDADPELSLAAFKQQVSFLKNPPLSEDEVLGYLQKCGLEKSIKQMRELL